MELQLALDLITKEEGFALVKQVSEYIDVVELGTPFSFVNPITSIRELKKSVPGVKFLAEFKIMDGGSEISTIAFEAGADITTVSARTWNGTIEQTIHAARKAGKQILVDLMGVPDQEIAARAKEVDGLKPDYICVHRAVSVAGSSSPEEPLRIVKEVVKNAQVAVAGGITCETLRKVVLYKPDLVIEGASIANAENPLEVAREMKKIMEDV